MARTRLYPPSVDPGFPDLPPTPEGWSRTTFADLLEVVERRIELDAGTKYRLLTAKRNRGGITLRGELFGREILTKSQFEAKGGDFLISRRQIIHGACGVVPEGLDGAVVSNEYSTLRTRPGFSMAFLRHYCHSPYFQRTCFHSSHGVDVEKMIFKIDEWLVREVDAPPPSEQTQIAAILSAVDEAIGATHAVIDQLQIVKKAMMAELLTRGLPGRHTKFKMTEIGEVPDEWEVVQLGDLLDEIDSGWSPRCEGRPAENEEWGVLKVSAVSWGEYRPQENKRLPVGLDPRPQAEVKAGDLLVSRANTPELVGRCVLVRETPPRLMLSDKILRLRAAPQHATPRFLRLVLEAPSSRQQIQDGATGSSRSMKNISQGKLRSALVPRPEVEEQQMISNLFDLLSHRVRSETESCSALRWLKSSLMSVLFTGEVRVKPNSEAA